MTEKRISFCAVLCALGVIAFAAAAAAESPDPLSFSLNDAYASAGHTAARLTPMQLATLQQPEEETVAESTTVTTFDEGDDWDLKGPYFLRSADPVEAGEMDLKFTFGYETSSGGGDDDSELEFELEWGMTEDIELIFGLPIEFGDGGIDGNADITLGLHTRFWKEDGLLPAVAMRNLIRVPSGYHSSGVDYTARLLVTKSIVPGRFRAHFNPFLKLVNGDNEEEARNFQWGAAVGVDYRLSDNLVFVADYLHRSSEEEGHRNNHAMELGLDWRLAEKHYLAFGSEIGLDGDSQGPNWGCKIMYILALNAPRLDAP
ncbi:MAG: hypothetical protein ACYSUI_09980 [Planctomycetota bacterium]|jgi:opacity protein-like surface antigen